MMILTEVKKAIVGKKFLKPDFHFSEIFSDHYLRSYFLKNLPEKFPDLKSIEPLLERLLEYKEYFYLLDLLKNNINIENIGFIISFFKKHYFSFDKEEESEFFQEESLRLLLEIVRLENAPIFSIFSFLNYLSRKRAKIYQSFERRDFEKEKYYVAEMLYEIFEKSREKESLELINLIKKTFDLISDCGDWSFYTPTKIFEILKKYILSDFQQNFPKILQIIQDQITKKYGSPRKDRIITPSVSWTNNNYHPYEYHFVDLILSPTLIEFYSTSPVICWKFIKDKYLGRTVADFMKRSTIPILIRQYFSHDQQASKEAYQYLKDFINTYRYLHIYIYQELKNVTSKDENKTYKLMEIAYEKDPNLPLNPFVEDLIGDLAISLDEAKSKWALCILHTWVNNPHYFKHDYFFGNRFVVNLKRLIDCKFKEGVEIFTIFVNGPIFANNFDKNDIYDLTKVLYEILLKDINVGIQILNKIQSHKNLTENQQNIIFRSLTQFENKEELPVHILNQLYDKFLDPFLLKFDNNISNFVKVLPYSYVREAIVEFADLLARAKEIEKALRIVKIFVNDPDPASINLEEDETPEKGRAFKYQVGSISTVRGWCAWVLMHCAVLPGRKHIGEVIELTEILNNDSHYYIQHMSCFSLHQLARVRLTHLPDNKDELFLNKDGITALQMAKKIESLAFILLRKIVKYPNKIRKYLLKNIAYVFDSISSLNQKEAKELIGLFKKCFNEEMLEDTANFIVPIFIRFAEFRKGNYKNWKWKSKGLYDDLEGFDDTFFKKELKNILQSSNKGLREALMSHILKISLNEDVENGFDKMISYVYEIAKIYDTSTYEMMYYFISKNLEARFEESFDLWKFCITQEIKSLKTSFKKKQPSSIPNWLSYHQDSILLTIKNKKGDKEFLKSIQLFMEYPEGVQLASILKSLKELKSFPKTDKTVLKIFNSLIKRNPNFYDLKDEWLDKKS